ncbi:MAG: MogA/MoaB family molybdenum cofactor biosynthesis protein [Planctomycetota bacterium]
MTTPCTPPPDSVSQHRQSAPKLLRAAVMTLSTTRTKENDLGGKYIAETLAAAGHTIVWYEVLKDDVATISAALGELRDRSDVDIIVTTGGTGISPMDVTIDAARTLFDRELTAFGVMFTMLSHEEVGMACLLSRATAGVMKDKVVFCLPGSPKACRLAMEKIILPEAGHIVKHAREAKR